MWGAWSDGYAIATRDPGHFQGYPESFCSVVDSWQKMTVQIDQIFTSDSAASKCTLTACVNGDFIL